MEKSNLRCYTSSAVHGILHASKIRYRSSSDYQPEFQDSFGSNTWSALCAWKLLLAHPNNRAHRKRSNHVLLFWLAYTAWHKPNKWTPNTTAALDRCTKCILLGYNHKRSSQKSKLKKKESWNGGKIPKIWTYWIYWKNRNINCISEDDRGNSINTGSIPAHVEIIFNKYLLWTNTANWRWWKAKHIQKHPTESISIKKFDRLSDG